MSLQRERAIAVTSVTKGSAVKPNRFTTARGCQRFDWKQHKAGCKESVRQGYQQVIHVERDECGASCLGISY
jgi:hypothetical protein